MRGPCGRLRPKMVLAAALCLGVWILVFRSGHRHGAKDRRRHGQRLTEAQIAQDQMVRVGESGVQLSLSPRTTHTHPVNPIRGRPFDQPSMRHADTPPFSTPHHARTGVLLPVSMHTRAVPTTPGGA